MRIWILPLILCFTNNLHTQNKVEQSLQNTLAEIYQQNPASIGILAHVEAPDLGISWSGAVGYSNIDDQSRLAADQPVLIASSIKTYVSATILKLVEQKKLSIDQAIAPLISKDSKTLFLGDNYDLSAIQIKHLLSHTSGIWNYANQDYLNHKKENPKYRWTRDEQLQLTIKAGDPVGPPGKQFHYSDANYLLLTEVIENLTKQPFYTAMRSLLNYEALKLNDTWFPTLEEKPKETKTLAHQYWRSFGWDAHDLDVSWDLYGGGGIACTTKDLARFIQHYFNGNIIKTDSIQNLIFTEIPTKETERAPYYLGLSHDNYHGMNAYGHGGFWSTVMLYFPTINASIAVCILNRDVRKLRRDVLDHISKILLNESVKKLDYHQQLSEYVNNIKDFSGTILVAQGDSIITQKAYGFSNIENKVPNNLETKFNLASISKLITAIGALQLVEQGKIGLNDRIGDFLPNYPNPIVRDSVTIHQLLTHTSGIPPFYGSKYLATDKIRYQQVKDFMPLFQKEPLSFKPGQKYQYSGSNFVLLGRIIEEVTGMNYYDYIDESIFKKSGMFNSMAFSIDSIILNKACGYTCLWGDQNYFSRNDYYLSKASPAGGHFSTVGDLYKFSKAISHGLLISPNTFQLLTLPKVKGYNTHLGYGIDIDQRYKERIIGHSGGWFGVRTELMMFLASDYTVVVLSNQDDDGNTGASKVIEEIKVIIAGNKKQP